MSKSPLWQTTVGKRKTGGLNKKGVEAYKADHPGSKLKTGVNKAPTSPQELKRQGSFRARFYGQTPLPPLKKPNGEPTRLALANTAWNGPVVKTVAQARAVAATGRRQLAKYKNQKSK